MKRRKGTEDDLDAELQQHEPSVSSKKVMTKLPAPGRSTPSLVGQPFVAAIEGLKAGTRAESVFTSVSLPYRVPHEGFDWEDNKPLTASFHTNTHVNDSGKTWTQGMLDTGRGNTSYFGDGVNQVIPQRLSLDRATFEGRAMKRLATDHYDPNAKRSTLSAEEFPYAGNIALQSHLEDVTAKRGLGFDRVGSAMRAKVMAEKWGMQQAGVQASADFADRMSAAFPQLGVGGATGLWDMLKTESGKTGDQAPAKTAHLGQTGSIHQAHIDARKQADARFQTKFGKVGGITSAEDAREKLGEWWGDNWDQVKNLSQKGENADAAANAYGRRKLERHGIAYDPTAQDPATHALPNAPAPLRGPDFLRGIANLANGIDPHDRTVFAEVSLPYRFKEEPADIVAFNFGTFSSKTRLNEGNTEPWTQGMMEPSMDTHYFGKTRAHFTGSVPNEMSLDRATMESRAMKVLSTADYDPAANEHKRVKVTREKQGAHFGDLTMGSFLEDITGKRALGFDDAGSAMRARMMEAKWTMKEARNGKKTGKFGQAMLEGLPQLGKEAWGGNYGAKNLWQNLQNEGKRSDILQHHQDSIAGAHIDARNAAGKRFDTKFAQLQEIVNDKTINDKHAAVQSRLGNSWLKHGEAISKVAALPRGTEEEASLYDQALSEVRSGYVDNKMTRHGMATYNASTKKPIKSFTGK